MEIVFSDFFFSWCRLTDRFHGYLCPSFLVSHPPIFWCDPVLHQRVCRDARHGFFVWTGRAHGCNFLERMWEKGKHILCCQLIIAQERHHQSPMYSEFGPCELQTRQRSYTDDRLFVLVRRRRAWAFEFSHFQEVKESRSYSLGLRKIWYYLSGNGCANSKRAT